MSSVLVLTVCKHSKAISALSVITLLEIKALWLGETDHLILGCVYSREVWSRVLSPLGLSSVVPTVDSGVIDW